jgi:hypothetical protein
VGEKQWSELVLLSFQSLVQDLPDLYLVDDGKKIALSNSPDSTFFCPSSDDIKTVAIALRDALATDGATQMCLSLLLSRYDNVKKLVGGRDVTVLAEVYPDAFRAMVLWKNDIGDVVVRLREDEAGGGVGATNGGRMQVDEVGLYSVASGRWGTAVANVMAQEAEKYLLRHPRDITAVDLNASVGGLTLALSKRFGAIIAIEIDEQRAALCVQNMKLHGRENVVVHNVDAMDAIRSLPSSVAVMIDPPWGGFEYKRLRKEVTMGQWSLDEVMVQCCRKLSPVVIGVRLPIKYDCTLIQKSLTAEGIVYDVLQTRRLGPQLLFVIAAH